MSFPVLIEAEQLSDMLSDSNLIVVDLSSAENYHKGHIPGAIHLEPGRLLRGSGPIPNKLPTTEQIQQLCNDLGLTPDSNVVAYDDQKGPLAGRLMWTLNIAGHTNCAVLNGQLNSWAKQPLQTTSNTTIPSQYPLNLNLQLLAEADEITTQLGNPDYQIWDARSLSEFTGEKVINAQKGGHIPGAIHFEWTDCLISEDNLRLKPADELRQQLSAAGLNLENTIVTHCQTHRRSGLTYLAARYIGIQDIRCYDGSWFEWGNLEDTPVET